MLLKAMPTDGIHYQDLRKSVPARQSDEDSTMKTVQFSTARRFNAAGAVLRKS